MEPTKNYKCTSCGTAIIGAIAVYEACPNCAGPTVVFEHAKEDVASKESIKNMAKFLAEIMESTGAVGH